MHSSFYINKRFHSKHKCKGVGEAFDPCSSIHHSGLLGVREDSSCFRVSPFPPDEHICTTSSSITGTSLHGPVKMQQAQEGGLVLVDAISIKLASFLVPVHPPQNPSYHHILCSRSVDPSCLHACWHSKIYQKDY